MPKTDVTVELFYSGAWNDITATDDVYTRDPLVITRGRPDESQRTPPSAMSLTVNNRDGRYSPRNPSSPLYGLIGRNTPIRVSVGASVRFVGEVESWPQRWSTDGRDVWSSIDAYGITRRLNAPGTTAPSRSALRRSALAADVTAYWPMEDGPDATQAASGLKGGQPLALTGAVAFVATLALAGSAGCADMSGGGQLIGPTGVASGTAASWEAEVAVGWDELPSIGSRVHIVSFDTPGSAIREWGIILTDDGVDRNLGIYRFTASGLETIGSSTNLPAIQAGVVYHFRIAMTQSGADVAFTRTRDGAANGSGTEASTTLTAPTVARVNPRAETVGLPTYLSHVAVWTPVRGSAETYQAAPAYVGETAADRMTRLCDEESIPFTVVGDGTASKLVGVQRVAPFLELLNDAAEADGGVPFEPRDSLGLAYRVHADLYNQAPALELDYGAGGEVAPPLDPVEDTDHVGNDWTITRHEGSSARAVKETGSLNTQEPGDDPDGVGRYQKDATLVLFEDGQCEQRAGWRRHLGTWDEARYPVVNLDLAAMDVEGKTALIADAAALDCGDRLAIANPPAWLPPETVEQHAQGFTETIESHRWGIAVNATPALPYEAFTVETGTGNRSRIPSGTGSTTLDEALDATETGVDITSVRVDWIDSATYPAHFPFDVMIGGERMTVTAITGTGLFQTFTVVRSVNGVVKTHAVGTAVQLFHPPVIAL